MSYTVYSTENCPKCEQLKKALKALGAKFNIVDMATSEALTELRINGVFTLTAPVLQAGDEFYTVEDLFESGRLKDLKSMHLAGRK